MENLSTQRTKISATPGSFRLEIDPKRKPGRWSLLWLPVGFVFWCYGVYGVVGKIIGEDDNTPLILSSLTLAGLVICGVAGAPVLLWNLLAGR